MTVFFTADTHFSSERALEHSKRPFASPEIMNNILIDNWNSLITNDDIVFHLGDFGDFSIAEKLHGKIYLVPGNHERVNPDFINYHDCFTKVLPDISSTILNDNTGEIYHIMMAHEPSKLRPYRIDYNDINLFGHLHKLCMVKPYGINVGVDCHNFKPITLETVLFYHNQIFTYFDDEVFN